MVTHPAPSYMASPSMWMLKVLCSDDLITLLLRIDQQGRIQEFYKGGPQPMASALSASLQGLGARSPQWDPGAMPLVRGSGERSPPPEADSIFPKLCMKLLLQLRQSHEIKTAKKLSIFSIKYKKGQSPLNKRVIGHHRSKTAKIMNRKGW